MRFYIGRVFRKNIDDVLKTFALSAWVAHGHIIGRFADDVKTIRGWKDAPEVHHAISR
jgi:hypothetical protein